MALDEMRALKASDSTEKRTEDEERGMSRSASQSWIQATTAAVVKSPADVKAAIEAKARVKASAQTKANAEADLKAKAEATANLRPPLPFVLPNISLQLSSHT